MNFQNLLGERLVEIVAGIVIGILSFIFGHKRGTKKEKNKNNCSDNKNKFKDVKTL